MEGEALILGMTVSYIGPTYLLLTMINPGQKIKLIKIKCYCLKAVVSNLKHVGTEGNMSLVRREGNWISSNLSGFSSEGTSSYWQYMTRDT